MRIPPQMSTPARVAVREKLKRQPFSTPKSLPPSESWWVGLETVAAFYRRAARELDRMRLSRYGRLDAASSAVDRWPVRQISAFPVGTMGRSPIDDEAPDA